jgi:hypothetical protein
MKTKAYKEGFESGFEYGLENNQFESDQDRIEYSEGYQQGVAEYCRKQDMQEAIKKKIINKLGISKEWAKDHLIVM